METGAHKQEMPPKGGYSGIQYERVPLKAPWSGAKIYSFIGGLTVFSYYLYYKNKWMVRRIKRANDDVTVAIEPLLVAERDRMFLKQIRKNRADEAELMKDVPGWKVGTLYGDPLYKTTEGKFMDPILEEYYAHSTNYDTNYMHTYHWWL